MTRWQVQLGFQAPQHSPIKHLLLDKRGDLTRLLDKLGAMSLVARETSLENRRVVLVSITTKGREQLHEIDTRLAEKRHLQGNLTFEEAERLNELLDLFTVCVDRIKSQVGCMSERVLLFDGNPRVFLKLMRAKQAQNRVRVIG